MQPSVLARWRVIAYRDQLEKRRGELVRDENEASLSADGTDYVVGQDNVQLMGLDVHNPVFAIAAGLVILFVSVGCATRIR